MDNQDFGVGIVLITPEGSIIELSYSLEFRATNNKAEYEAVVTGHKMAITVRVMELEVHCHLLLIVSEINRECTTKDDQMVAYKIITTWKVKFSPFATSSRSRDLRIATQTLRLY